MEALTDTINLVVIDHGSAYIKAGFSGEDSPRLIIPSVIGTFEPTEQGRPIVKKNGAQLNLMKPECPLSFPIERGVIKNTEESWEHMCLIWEYIFNELQVDPTTANVLIADSPNTPRENRLKIAEYMLGNFRVSSLGIVSTAVLSLISTGRTRGLLVDAGDGATNIVPIFETFPLAHATKMMKLAGKDVTNFMHESLESVLTPAQFAVARAIKEKTLLVPHDYDHALQSPDALSLEERSYELPDGRVIQVDKNVRLVASEMLFRPSLVGENCKSLHQLILDSVNKCDNDLRNDMYSNIVLSGGTSMMRGFSARIEHELKQSLPSSLTTSDLRVVSDSFRKHAAWIGGSMLASLDTFGKYLTISKAQWDDENEVKSSLVQRSSF
jgi:actin-related protein